MNKKEIDVVSVPGQGALLVHEPRQKVDLTKYLDNQAFQFDYSFDESATNDLVYKYCVFHGIFLLICLFMLKVHFLLFHVVGSQPNLWSSPCLKEGWPRASPTARQEVGRLM